MQSEVVTVTFGGLFHDTGKIVYRSGLDGRAHSVSGADFLKAHVQDALILDCVRYHHKAMLIDARLPSNHPAYIVYIADNIASGSDRRKAEGSEQSGFDRTLALASLFNLLADNTGKESMPPDVIGSVMPTPTTGQIVQAHQYKTLLSKYEEGLRGILTTQPYIASLLELTEACFSGVPCSTLTDEVPDISLFDHAKITAAYAACISQYLKAGGITDYRAALMDGEAAFCREKAFLLVSVDMSGIQSFLYGISGKGALKSLRARSFYLEILLENCADELLSACGLSRANLLYSGGGHAYFLLANTDETIERVNATIAAFNGALMRRFDAALYIAHGLCPCSANELMSKTDDASDYPNLFRSVSGQISRKKLARYGADEIRLLNERHPAAGARECLACGQSGTVNENGLCELCGGFVASSNRIVAKDAVFIVVKGAGGLPLYSADGEPQSLRFGSEEEARRLLSETPDAVSRLYSKNLFRTGLALASKLWVGDYAATDGTGNLKTFEDMAGGGNGISRIGVLRADVDNLGAAFTQGFVRHHEKEPYRYLTLSRTAAFSRSLSLFFKYYINDILRRPVYRLPNMEPTGDLTIVYSGGDDVFLAGAWDEVICAAVNLHRALQTYSGGTLTLSAGLGVFNVSYPIAAMARETGELEALAKRCTARGLSKDAVALFGTDEHVYHWDDFLHCVLTEKLTLLCQLFAARDDIGHAFLYGIIELLRAAQRDRLNIARLAYLLARRECPRGASPEAVRLYAEFTRKVYQWALDPENRRQLLTAMMIFVYTRRAQREDR